jgi:hypothetical protein
MRLQDWPERLASVIDGAMNKPFAWGSHDCCTFANDCIIACTGASAWPELKWHDSKSAAKLVREFGGLKASLDGYLTRLESIALAKRGDVVIVDNGGREVVGVCIGSSIAAPGVNGLEFIPIDLAKSAWSVG